MLSDSLVVVNFVCIVCQIRCFYSNRGAPPPSPGSLVHIACDLCLRTCYIFEKSNLAIYTLFL